MRVAVIGYGKQGLAAVKYWQKDNDVTVCDKDKNIRLPDGVEAQLGDDYLKNLDRFHLIIRSPIIHPRDIVKANSERILQKVTTVTEEFFRVCPAPIIGVTGTKGKGTTSSLIAKILEVAGKKVHLGGNIGIAPLEMLDWDIKPSDWVILELANFQLIDLRVSPKIAVCLMVAPEHLDWHQDMTEYIKAKQNLFKFQSGNDLAIFNRLNDFSTAVAEVSPALKLSYEVPLPNGLPEDKNGAYVLGDSIYMDDEKVCNINQVKLLGRHNLENVCAAIATTWDIIGHNPEIIIQAVSTFSGLPFRLELVHTVNNVDYYNDSFGTTPETAMVALQAIDKPKILILGGSDKGVEFDQLALSIKQTNVKEVIVIGKTAQKIVSALQAQGFNNITDAGKNMDTIVSTAQAKARPGDAVLLSTACASFDMFKNYIDRGEQFNDAVRNL
ncbi:UDP-N-acetylmuramoyl-L-alanine--D-glutamate ligase [Candidatus Saccharibacteria bacterium]|nr:UDP-N-acetylmuramoyl-L-alanine--D-glutamate ligase [Candidatus Saccharibacteria bacterium]